MDSECEGRLELEMDLEKMGAQGGGITTRQGLEREGKESREGQEDMKLKGRDDDLI